MSRGNLPVRVHLACSGGHAATKQDAFRDMWGLLSTVAGPKNFETWDGKPLIGRTPRWSNVLLAAGHNMLGLSMAPATGRLVAELVTGEATFVDPTPYGLTRFA